MEGMKKWWVKRGPKSSGLLELLVTGWDEVMMIMILMMAPIIAEKEIVRWGDECSWMWYVSTHGAGHHHLTLTSLPLLFSLFFSSPPWNLMTRWGWPDAIWGGEESLIGCFDPFYFRERGKREKKETFTPLKEWNNFFYSFSMLFFILISLSLFLSWNSFSPRSFYASSLISCLMMTMMMMIGVLHHRWSTILGSFGCWWCCG